MTRPIADLTDRELSALCDGWWPLGVTDEQRRQMLLAAVQNRHGDNVETGSET